MRFKADKPYTTPKSGVVRSDAIKHLIRLEMSKLSEKDLYFDNPMLKWTRQQLENPGLAAFRLLRDPDYCYLACKHLLNVRLLPFQQVILREMWYRPFPMLIASRGAGKSWLLAVYAVLRALFLQGRKVVVTGAGFRQAKIIMQYAESFWYNSPVLRSMVQEVSRSGPHHDADKWEMRLGDSTITALPLGDGSKIRGYRAHDILADEFASIPREIFETVVAGFGVVELEPYEKVERAAEIAVYKRMGVWTDEMEEAERLSRVGNQSIISGTAYYQFNHFAEYWRRWKGIIHSKGDPDKIRQVIGGEPEPGFDWRDYSIIRLPVHLLPPGYMDERHIARSKATVHSGVYLNEFGAVFSSDTNGFFKRTLVESCVTNTPIQIGGELVQFRCAVRGNPNFKYVYGVDPASENDKFSIVILELHETHQRVVYCWTFDKAEHNKRLQTGLTTEKDFYAFCARKIRSLMKVFPCEHIALDSQGGGVAIREALHDDDKLGKGERPIWEIRADHPLGDGKPKPTDNYPGLHILQMCHFANAEYTAEANHGLRKDFEDKICLFPMSNDTLTLAIAWEADETAGRTVDTYEDCFNEIEELKEELATIVHTQNPGSNRDRWDTPEIKLPGSRKGRLRKDRYSALVMANMAARRIQRKPVEVPYENYGGFVGQVKTQKGGQNYISGPAWFVDPANQTVGGYGKIVRRGVK